MANTRDPRPFILFLILIFLLNSPEQQQQSFGPHSRYDHTIARERDALDVLNKTHYGSFDTEQGSWLNLTGFRHDDGLAWSLLKPVQQRVREQTVALLGAQTEASLNGSLEDSRYTAVYHNVTGHVKGEWVWSKVGHGLPAPHLNISSILPENAYPFSDYDRNLTGTSGSVRLHFNEAEGRTRADMNKSTSDISVRMVIGDDTSMGDWWEFTLHGVHFLKFGGILLTTTSEKFSGIFALPHLTLNEHLYSISQEILNLTIQDMIIRQTSRSIVTSNPWSSAVDGSSDSLVPALHCEYVVYLQQHPVLFHSPSKLYPSSNPYYLKFIEDELRYPTGSPLPGPSQLSMSMVAFSPDCGFVIESKGPPDYTRQEGSHLKGSKLDIFMSLARRSTLIFAVVIAVQLMFLVRQMKETSTPSTRSRVGFYTIATLALGDGFAFLTLVFMHLYSETSLLALHATTSLALFSVVFELRFLMDIWTVQATERRRQERQEGSATTTNSMSARTPQDMQPMGPVISAGGSDSLPLLVTANRPGVDTGTTPIILPSDQDGDEATENTNVAATGAAGTAPTGAELGALYTRYCFLLFVTCFLTLHSTSWPTAARSIYSNTLLFIYLSFWCPQIYRNIMRNCRKALRWDFVIGQSAVRLIPITYFYAVSSNIFFAQTDLRALSILVGWIWIQIMALLSQDILGPRFLIREGWAPPAYDYHPILREDEEGANMPIGSTQLPEDYPASPSAVKPGESKEKGKKIFDCTICTQDIEVSVIPAGGPVEGTSGIGGNILSRRAYMVTPCRHIFHTPCLEGWMRYRLQCPNCRDILPPL